MSDEIYKQNIKSRIENVQYPTVLVVDGPENSSRTRYSREHPGVFGIQLCENVEEAIEFIYHLNYEGTISEMRIYSLPAGDVLEV